MKYLTLLLLVFAGFAQAAIVNNGWEYSTNVENVYYGMPNDPHFTRKTSGVIFGEGRFTERLESFASLADGSPEGRAASVSVDITGSDYYAEVGTELLGDVTPYYSWSIAELRTEMSFNVVGDTVYNLVASLGTGNNYISLFNETLGTDVLSASQEDVDLSVELIDGHSYKLTAEIGDTALFGGGPTTMLHSFSDLPAALVAPAALSALAVATVPEPWSISLVLGGLALFATRKRLGSKSAP